MTPKYREEVGVLNETTEPEPEDDDGDEDEDE